MLNGGKVGTTFYDNFLRFLDHFISTFSNRNGYDKFQLLKLSIKKVGCYLFCYIQYGPPRQGGLRFNPWGGLGWRERESILRSKYDFFDGAAGSVESRKAGGDNGHRYQQ